MDVGDHLGRGDVEQLGAFAGGQSGTLQHRAHGAVDDEDVSTKAHHDVRHARSLPSRSEALDRRRKPASL